MNVEDPATAARLRAMSLNRMVDYGMAPADARRLRAEATAGVPWGSAARAIADEQADAVQVALASDDAAAAVAAARHAVGAAAFAHMEDNHDTPLKRGLYARYAADVAVLTGLLGMERREVAFGDGALVGWSLVPQGARGTVVVWGGLTGWGAVYTATALAIAGQGMACLLVEGPGQGASRLEHGVVADERLVEGFGCFIDLALSEPRLGGRVGIMGSSFGGLFAANLAARDPRVAACVVNGGPWDPVVPGFRMQREQMEAAFGTEDDARIAAILRSLWLGPRSIECPALVLHGGVDPLVSDADAEAMAACSDRGEVRRWADGEHTLYNHGRERDEVAARWLRARLDESAALAGS